MLRGHCAWVWPGEGWLIAREEASSDGCVSKILSLIYRPRNAKCHGGILTRRAGVCADPHFNLGRLNRAFVPRSAQRIKH